MGSDNEPRDSSGLEIIKEEDKKSSPIMSFVFTVGFPAVGFGLGYAISNYASSAATDAKIAWVIKEDFHWAYMTSFVFSRMISYLNMAPMAFKSRIMTGKAGGILI